jgi:hypothetical protein
LKKMFPIHVPVASAEQSRTFSTPTLSRYAMLQDRNGPLIDPKPWYNSPTVRLRRCARTAVPRGNLKGR